MKPKPDRPCGSCGSTNWWWREAIGPGEWLCGVCHPNPDKEGVMKEEVELVDGKFIVKGKQAKEVETKEAEIIPKQYGQGVLELKDRVIKGNRKLFDAWLQIREIAHNTEEWSRQMDRWHEAQERLSALCSQLKVLGYDDCLYIVNNERVKACLKNPDGFWCQVCPSTYPYWEKELKFIGD